MESIVFRGLFWHVLKSRQRQQLKMIVERQKCFLCYCLKSRDEKNFYPGMCRYPCSAAYKNWRWPDWGFRSSDLERNADMTHPLSSAWCGSYLIILENRSVENVRWLKNLRIEGFHVKNILILMYCWFAIYGLRTLTCTRTHTQPRWNYVG